MAYSLFVNQNNNHTLSARQSFPVIEAIRIFSHASECTIVHNTLHILIQSALSYICRGLFLSSIPVSRAASIFVRKNLKWNLKILYFIHSWYLSSSGRSALFLGTPYIYRDIFSGEGPSLNYEDKTTRSRRWSIMGAFYLVTQVDTKSFYLSWFNK